MFSVVADTVFLPYTAFN
ncbi:hypothetical protein QZH46_02390 [Pseudomonas corrugata]